MALRNYLYAKHSDSIQSILINKAPGMRTPRVVTSRKQDKEDGDSCPPERQIVLDDGTSKCANCADCPKKRDNDGNPRIKVQVGEELTSSLSDMSIQEVDYTST